jgi:ComF family protein
MVNRISALAEGLFPNYCVLCGLRSYRVLPLCFDCEADMQTNSLCCYRCAIPLPAAVGLEGEPDQPAPRLCGGCLQSPPAFQRAIAPWLYCEQLGHIIHRWKYGRETRLTGLLAALWLQQSSTVKPVDLIIPVPLHWRRLCRRGFNQAELLCRALRATSPTLASAGFDNRSVRRQRSTEAQSGMDASARAANMRGAFTARGRYANLRIAIVDDVLTTGATCASLAGVLRQAGAGHVEVWCLARTPAPGT